MSDDALWVAVERTDPYTAAGSRVSAQIAVDNPEFFDPEVIAELEMQGYRQGE